MDIEHQHQLTETSMNEMVEFLEEKINFISSLIEKNNIYGSDESHMYRLIKIKNILLESLELVTNFDGFKYSSEPSSKEVKRLMNDLILLKWRITLIVRNEKLFPEIAGLDIQLKKNEIDIFNNLLLIIDKKAELHRIDLINHKVSFVFTQYPDLSEQNPIKSFVSSNLSLIELNKQRKRNVILLDNATHQVIYDLAKRITKLINKIPVSTFEHDTNGPYLEEVCIDFLYNFDNKKGYYLKLLTKKQHLYQDQIDILNGTSTANLHETLTLISLLGRLHQENLMGPISTYRTEKLFPTYIIKNHVALTYVRETIKTLEEYRSLFLTNNTNIHLIPSIDKGVVVYSDSFSSSGENNLLTQIKNPNIRLETEFLPSLYEAEGLLRPNYLLSFFTKFVASTKFISILPLFNSNEDIADLADFSKRYRGTPNDQDFIIAAKTRNILMSQKADDIIEAIHEVYLVSKEFSYSRKIASYLIDQSKNIMKELHRAFHIFDTFVEKEKHDFKEERTNMTKEHNNAYLSIGSDMHFRCLDNYEKSNYSNQFNVIAGDFTDNLFHRGNAELVGTSDLIGVGVLGNHDVFLDTEPTRNLSREIRQCYKRSIKQLKIKFPNVKILNDEIIYRDGYAIIGMTLFYDINNGVRTFFANEAWGKMYEDDDYIKRAKDLLDKVPKETPVIFVSHSPFKEYAVCTNRSLGVPSKNIFKKYPNVKIYIHGHGHSKPKSKIIDGILCITNPLVFNEVISEVSFSKEELYNIFSAINPSNTLIN